MYIEMLKQRYPGVNENELYGDYCPGGFFKYGPDSGRDDCTAECDICWHKNADSDEEWKEDCDYDVPEEWKEISAPAPSETNVTAFGYSELDADTAAKLEAITNSIISVRKNYIFAMAEQVKKAHDLLANCKNGMFGAWCDSIGISRYTGNNLVNIVELFNNSTLEEQENLNKLADTKNTKLLYEAARPSAPTELVEQVKSGDITTHKEYIELKKQLEAAEEKAESEKKAREAVLQNLDNITASYKEYKDKYSEEYYKNAKLANQIKELESRPVDVAVQPDSDAERKFSETIRKINLDFEIFRDEADKELADMRNQRNKALDRAEAAEAKLNAPKAESDIKPFVVKMTYDDLSAIIEALSGSPKLQNIMKKVQVLRV